MFSGHISLAECDCLGISMRVCELHRLHGLAFMDVWCWMIHSKSQCAVFLGLDAFIVEQCCVFRQLNKLVGLLCSTSASLQDSAYNLLLVNITYTGFEVTDDDLLWGSSLLNFVVYLLTWCWSSGLHPGKLKLQGTALIGAGRHLILLKAQTEVTFIFAQSQISIFCKAIASYLFSTYSIFFFFHAISTHDS